MSVDVKSGSDGFPWKAISSGTLSVRIVEQMREALFHGRLSPGERLGSEHTLAGRFGVSRMAARDALRSLAAIGIVDVRVGLKGGVFVAHGSQDRLADALAVQLALLNATIEEVMDAQIAIEVTSTELAAKNATRQDINKLQHLLQEIVQLAASRVPETNAAEFAARSMAFHEAVVEASHNRILISQFRALRMLLEPIYTAHTSPKIVQGVIDAHAALLKCLRARDADGARRLMRDRLAFIRQAHLIGTRKGANKARASRQVLFAPRRKQRTR